MAVEPLKYRPYGFVARLRGLSFWALYPVYMVYKRIAERGRVALLRNRITRGARVLDIGANIGYYTTLFALHAGTSGCVHAFEPDPRNFSRLLFTMRRWHNVVLNNVAVGEVSGTLRLHRSSRLFVDHRCYDSGDNRRTIDVPSVAIDDYFKNGETIDCVKIDIQGFEVAALKGMRATLARSPRVLFVGEMWPFGLRTAGSSVEEYADLLRSSGFASDSLVDSCVRSLRERSDDQSFYTDVVAEKGEPGV